MIDQSVIRAVVVATITSLLVVVAAVSASDHVEQTPRERGGPVIEKIVDFQLPTL